MTKADDGGPAFPVPDGEAADQGVWGMSLRDWLIGQNVKGLLSNPAVMTAERLDEVDNAVRGGARVSYVAEVHADAVLYRLAARAKGSDTPPQDSGEVARVKDLLQRCYYPLKAARDAPTGVLGEETDGMRRMPIAELVEEIRKTLGLDK